MSYYNDMLNIDPDIKIRGVAMPQTTEPVLCTPELTSDGGRLADDITYEGDIKGVKHTIKLTYSKLNKKHFDLLYSNTMKIYEDNPSADMFFDITVPTYTPNGVKTYTVYLGASSFSSMKCTETTEKMGGQYARGGLLYDELHENIEINFVEK